MLAAAAASAANSSAPSGSSSNSSAPSSTGTRLPVSSRLLDEDDPLREVAAEINELPDLSSAHSDTAAQAVLRRCAYWVEATVATLSAQQQQQQQQQHGQRTASQYYVTFLTLLKRPDVQQRLEDVAAVVLLVAHVVPQLSAGMAQATFDQLAPFLDDIVMQADELSQAKHNAAAAAAAALMPGLLASTVRITGHFLAKQRTVVWAKPTTQRLWSAVLEAAVASPHEPVRANARKAVHTVLAQKTSLTRQCVSAFSDKCMEKLGDGDVDVDVHVAKMLQSVVSYLPLSTFSGILQGVLTATTAMGNPTLLVATLRTLQAVFDADVAKPPRGEDSLPPVPPRQIELVNSLLDHLDALQPHSADVDSSVAFLRTLGSGVSRLARDTRAPLRAAPKLPGALQLLATSMLSSKQPVVKAAAQAIKKVVHQCFTPALALQALQALQVWKQSGGGPLAAAAAASATGAAPTALDSDSPLAACLRVFASLLTYKYTPVFREVMACFKTLFYVTDARCLPLLAPLLRNLDSLRHTDDEAELAHGYHAAIDAALGAAVRNIGAHLVLEVLPLDLEVQADMPLMQSLKRARRYMLPLLAAHVYGSHLSYFWRVLRPMAQQCATLLAQVSGTSHAVEQRALQDLLEQFWTVFISFCQAPLDGGDADMWNTEIGPEMAAILDTPAAQALHVYLAKGLDKIVKSCRAVINKRRNGDDDDDSDSDSEDEQESSPAPAVVEARDASEQEAQSRIDTANATLAALAGIAGRLLPRLFNALRLHSVQEGRPLLNAIGSLASVCPSDDINTLFQQCLSKLLSPEQKADAAGGAKPLTHEKLLHIALELCPFATQENVTIFFRTIQPLFSSNNTSVVLQRLAYKAIAAIAQSHVPFMQSQAGQVVVWQAVLQACQQARENVHQNAVRHRMLALEAVVKSIPRLAEQPAFVAVFPALLGETILRTRQGSHRTHEAAEALLITMGEQLAAHVPASAQSVAFPVSPAAMAVSHSGSPTSQLFLTEFMLKVSAGLSSPDPSMVAATVHSLTTLTYTFRDRLPQGLLTELLGTSLLVFQTHHSKEVIKSLLSFVKVSTVFIHPELLMNHLVNLIAALTIWNDRADQFRKKIGTIFGILISRCGAQTVRDLTPPSHQRLVDYMRRTKAREARLRTRHWVAKHAPKDGDDESARSRVRQARAFVQDEQKNDGAGASGSGASAAPSSGLASRADVWIKSQDVDLLDASVVRHIVASNPENAAEEAAMFDGGAGDLDEGRVSEDREGRIVVSLNDDAMLDSDDDDDDGDVSMSGKKGKKGKKVSPLKRKRRGADEDAQDDSSQRRKGGRRSVKVRRREPKRNQQQSVMAAMHPQMLNRRKTHKTKKQLEAVMRAAVRGGKEGTKQSRRQGARKNRRNL